MLTRKDYVAIANALRDIERLGEDDYRVAVAYDDVVLALADYMAADNPRFNRDEFLRFCWVERVTCI